MADIELRVATEFNVVKVRVTKEGQERVARLTTQSRCLGCEEPLVEGEPHRRGLCATCYQGVRNAIKRHGAQESELMRQGRILPPQPGGRKPSNKFTAELCGRPLGDKAG